jgi:outer membrane protein OmpA-like peptidoglycan-associated protein
MGLRILFISLSFYFPFVLFAQKEQNREMETAGYKTSFVRNNAGSNWFINLDAGIQTVFGDNTGKTKLSNRLSFVPAVAVGKWFNPYWGVRLRGQGGRLHGFEDGISSEDYFNAHIDALWDLSNCWGVYSPEKSFHIIPYAGLGYGRRLGDSFSGNRGAAYSKQSCDALSVNGGCRFGVRLSKRIQLDMDFGIAVVPDYFDRIIAKTQNDIITTLTGGLTFHLGKMNFETIIPFDSELVNDLNSKVNQLRTDNERLSKRPEACPESPVIDPEISSEINYIPNVVFFRINSAKVDKNQQISVFNTAEFLNVNGGKIRIVGYADKGTGAENYNLALSEKRAKAVAKELVSKYNIPSYKIVVEWKGSSEQPYAENSWNRVVIMSAE